MAFLTILGQGREARARAGHRGDESPASQRDLATRRDPRVPARGRACVRTPFARLLVSKATRGDVAVTGDPRRDPPSTGLPSTRGQATDRVLCRGGGFPVTA
jgi:hypothetical protein